MIALESVSKRYGSKTIIHDISFSVGKDEIVGFLGPNGAGKTTTMRMISGYTTPSAGRILVAGFDMVEENEEAARRIGYLPENPPLYDVMDVTAYLRFVARIKGVPKRTLASDLDRVIQSCRLEAVVTREIYKLSKGYRQRLGLAQALLGSPDVLLLDEPTSALDPISTSRIEQLIEELKQSYTIAIVTHNMQQAVRVSQYTAFMYLGEMVEFDDTDKIFTAPKERRTQDYITGRFG